jgi:hypothetical protein
MKMTRTMVRHTCTEGMTDSKWSLLKKDGYMMRASLHFQPGGIRLTLTGRIFIDLIFIVCFFHS